MRWHRLGTIQEEVYYLLKKKNGDGIGEYKNCKRRGESGGGRKKEGESH